MQLTVLTAPRIAFAAAHDASFCSIRWGFSCLFTDRESLCKLVQHMLATFCLFSVCTERECLGTQPMMGRLFSFADQRAST